MKFISKFILSTERVIRWFIFIITVFVMFYLVVHSLMMFFATSTPQADIPRSGYDFLSTSIEGWKVYRNLMYLLLILDLPLVGLSVFIKEKSGGIVSALKSVGIWFGLLNLVAFSYALSGLVFDLCMVGYTFFILVQKPT
ncbi:MAG TPA: hypothetical protein PKJ26_02225 [Candidatus Woesebacteria bacterium]|nr:hypothetical protein [Candidatus Woesebacteria bacterium]HNS65292.1 hypothetical protein [Candidatus Woesebacteria bacterium]